MEPSPIQNPNPNSSSPLSATISLFQSLISLAESTISTVSSSFLQNPNLLPCPHDPNHRVPPESLFRHSLLCSSAPPLPDLLLRTPQTLTPAEDTQNFTHRLSDDDAADLCFSLDRDASNFFYRDCPGVVSTPDPDDADRTFTLPAMLCRECANFEDGELEKGEVQILPSERWAVKCEVEGWGDFPRSYSVSVARVCSGLNRADKCGFKRWIISESLRFGIVVDVTMRDHVFLLLDLCCRAVMREAVCNLKLPRSEDVVCSFGCPKLVGSFIWLASQLSVLFGEVNGKFFALGMLKESVLRAGSGLMVDLADSQPSGVEVGSSSEDCAGGRVFVSQVAAAVAALHDRFALEQRIRALRYGSQLPKFQRVNDYLHASKRACELRGKRPNYKPLLEHDGLPWQRVNNQDSGRAKTREEMLAEERDYKRRRMSYRGKKVKRNPTEVLRDIIEQHMEEIKKAGGIGCNVNYADAVPSQYQTNSQNGTSCHIKPQNNKLDASEIQRQSHGYQKLLHSEYNSTSGKDRNPYFSDGGSEKVHDSQDPQERHRRERSGHREDYKKSSYVGDKNHVSRYPSNRSDSQPRHRYEGNDSIDRHAHHNEEGDREAHRNEYDKRGSSNSHRYRGHDSRSALTSISDHDILKKEKAYMSKSRNTSKGRSSGKFWSELRSEDNFEDRYDPSRSYDRYDPTFDEVSVGSTLHVSDMGHSTTSDAKYNDEQLTHGYDGKNCRRYK